MLSVNKKIILSIIDKIQPIIRRTIIKGTLVWGRGVLCYFHTYIGSRHFLGFKILNLTIFGGFQKNEYFLGYEDFVDIFLGHHKIGLYLGVILCILGSFLKVMVQNGGYLLGC